jgi:hypothetical protein
MTDRIPNKDDERIGRFIPYIVLIIGIVIGIFIGLSIQAFFGSYLDPLFKIRYENQKLDECFQILYETTIHDAGKAEIDSTVTRTSHLGKDPSRLTLIANIITSNFTDPNWDYQKNSNFFCYYPDDNVFTYCLLGQHNLTTLKGQVLWNGSYMFDKRGRIRQYNKESREGIILNTNPYWISFQQTGECQDLSILFNETANESGFITRIIRSDGIGHFWNEVNIDGEWKFFDVQQYGGMKGSINSSQWFGNTSDYANIIPWKLCDMIKNGTKPGIFVYDVQTNGYAENRNAAYDPGNLCS